jgi:hypothetical protein
LCPSAHFQLVYHFFWPFIVLEYNTPPLTIFYNILYSARSRVSSDRLAKIFFKGFAMVRANSILKKKFLIFITGLPVTFGKVMTYNYKSKCFNLTKGTESGSDGIASDFLHPILNNKKKYLKNTNSKCYVMKI